MIVINENKCVRYNTEESLCICYVTVKTLAALSVALIKHRPVKPF